MDTEVDTEVKPSLVRDEITITFLGKEYAFDRPVISMRRKMLRATFKITECFAQMDYPDGKTWLDAMDETVKPLTTPKNMGLFMDAAEEIITFLAKYCTGVAEDEQVLRDALDDGTLTDGEIGTEFGKLKGFVEAPSEGATAAEIAPDTTSESG